MSLLELILLVGTGLVAGVINTLAGGGSLLSVPLLVFLGLPGDLANGTNRIGVAMQGISATWQFRADGVSGVRAAIPVLVPVALGSLVGATAVAQLDARAFERVFGIAMLVLLIPTLRGVRRSGVAGSSWSPLLRWSVFFGIGFYGGAIQAGVGLLLVMALSRSGYDLVRANSIKVVVVASLTLVAVPVFVAAGQVMWLPAGFLTLGFACGGVAGARIAVLGGERVIRPVLGLAVVGLAGRMLGLY